MSFFEKIISIDLDLLFIDFVMLAKLFFDFNKTSKFKFCCELLVDIDINVSSLELFFKILINSKYNLSEKVLLYDIDTWKISALILSLFIFFIFEKK